LARNKAALTGRLFSCLAEKKGNRAALGERQGRRHGGRGGAGKAGAAARRQTAGFKEPKRGRRHKAGFGAVSLFAPGILLSERRKYVSGRRKLTGCL